MTAPQGFGWGREAGRVVRLFWGLFLYALGIVMTVHANVGASPWDVFHIGVSKHLGISFGAANIAVSASIVAATALMKERIGFGTLCNMVAIGAFIDLLRALGWVPQIEAFLPGLVMMIAGLFVIALATVFYMGAGYGSGPRDSLMVALSKRTGRTPGFCRVCVEGTALFFGWLLGGGPGVGTVIAAFGIGFAVQVVFQATRFDVTTLRQESIAETARRIASGGAGR